MRTRHLLLTPALGVLAAPEQGSVGEGMLAVGKTVVLQGGSGGLLLPQSTAWGASAGEEAGVCPRSISGFLSPVSTQAVQIKTWSEGV